MSDALRLALRQEYRRTSMRAALAADPIERIGLTAAANRLFEALHGAAPSANFDGAVIALLAEGNDQVTYPDGGSSPLHCTIAYLGDAQGLDDRQTAGVMTLCGEIAKLLDPFEASVVSPAQFGDTPVHIVEHEDVQAARIMADEDEIVGQLRADNDEHPHFVPHVSGLGESDTIRFDRVAAMIGGTIYEFPLGTGTTQTPDRDQEMLNQGVLTP